jgi:hypothetical protein
MRRDLNAYEERCRVRLIDHAHPERGVVFLFSPGETAFQWERAISLDEATRLLERHGWRDAGHMVGSTLRMFWRIHTVERPLEDAMSSDHS